MDGTCEGRGERSTVEVGDTIYVVCVARLVLLLLGTRNLELGDDAAIASIHRTHRPTLNIASADLQRR